MQIYRHYEPLPPWAQGAVVAVGNFDGVHLGHRMLIAEAEAVARPLGVRAAVMCFEPHPRTLFRPGDPPFRLTPFRIRARILEELGVSLHFVLTFDEAFAHKSAEQFIADVLVGGLKAHHVVIGYDFRFGHQRRGDAEMLLAFGRRHDFGVTVVTAAADETGGVYSSSRTRELLRAGKPREAAEILGRPWEVEGRVEHGHQRGRLLGYPTANVDLGEYMRPAYGVYAVRAALDVERPLVWHDGVANLGIRPMYQLDRPLLEAHLFDFSGDLYHRHLRVQLVEYLRGEAKFDGVEQLRAQMDLDSAAAHEALAQD